MDNEGAAFKPETIGKVLAMHFTDPKTKVNSEAIKLSAEFLKLFVREAAHRAGELALAQDEAEVSMDTLEKILPQLRENPCVNGTVSACMRNRVVFVQKGQSLAAVYFAKLQTIQSTLSSSEVSPGVFVGTAAAAANSQLLKEHNITWLLSTCPAANELPLCITHHLNLGLLDESDVDLLGALPEAISFIDRAQEAVAGVLVHCVEGVSRSCSVVMAWLLANDRTLTCPAAFRILKRAHRPACPNEGFRRQIKLFKAMGSRIDPDHPQYRIHRLQSAVQLYDAGANMAAKLPLAPDPHNEEQPDAQMIVRCRKCRRRLATDINELSHMPGSGQLAFRWHRRDLVVDPAVAAATPQCNSQFIEPMAWMGSLIEAGLPEGKLNCPSCAARVGAFHWHGSQCSCGAWIVPSFYFVKSKVDRLPICPRPVGNGGAERSTSLRGGGLPPSVAEERIADISLSRETQGIQ